MGTWTGWLEPLAYIATIAALLLAVVTFFVQRKGGTTKVADRGGIAADEINARDITTNAPPTNDAPLTKRED